MVKIKPGTSEYSAIHYWLKKNYGKADKCEGQDCRGVSQRYSWALIKGCEYESKRENFMMLCNSCHVLYDKNGDVWNKGKKMNSEYRKKCRERGISASVRQAKLDYHARQTHCKRGHEYTEENTFRNERGQRNCKICMRENSRRRRASLKKEIGELDGS